MESSRLKRYTPEARQAFIAAVSAQAAKLGIAATGIAEAQGQGDVLLVGGQAFPKTLAASRPSIRSAATGGGMWQG